MDRSRFERVFNSNPQCLIAGVGATGSHLTYILNKLGWVIDIVDPDKVTSPNIAVALFSESDIDKPKVVALTNAINSLAIRPIYGKVEDVDLTPYNVVFACTDNFTSKRYIYQNARNIVVETQISAYSARAFGSRGTQFSFILSQMPSDDWIPKNEKLKKIYTPQCGEVSITDMACLAASYASIIARDMLKSDKDYVELNYFQYE